MSIEGDTSNPALQRSAMCIEAEIHVPKPQRGDMWQLGLNLPKDLIKTPNQS